AGANSAVATPPASARSSTNNFDSTSRTPTATWKGAERHSGGGIPLPTEILDGVDHHCRADGDHQDVPGDANIAVAGRRHADLNNQRLRYFVIDNVAWQGPAHLPFLRLSGWHAAVVLFRQSRRAAAGLVVVAVVFAHHDALRLAEMRARGVFP